MIRQYHAQRHHCIDLAGRLRAVGIVPVGSIALIEGRKIQVEAWLPQDYIAVEHGRVGHLSDAFLVDAAALAKEEPSGRALRRRAQMRDRGSNATLP